MHLPGPDSVSNINNVSLYNLKIKNHGTLPSSVDRAALQDMETWPNEIS